MTGITLFNVQVLASGYRICCMVTKSTCSTCDGCTADSMLEWCQEFCWWLKVTSILSCLAFTCGQLTRFLREESLLPALGAEPAAASAPFSPPYPRARAQPISGPWGCGRAGTPPRPALCCRRRDAPAQEQAILTPVPHHGGDAAEVAGRCCGFTRLTAAAMQERACSSWIPARRGLVRAGCEGSEQTCKTQAETDRFRKLK